MEKNCLFCKGFWPFLLIPLILLILAILFQWRSIEADVAENTLSSLSGSDTSWAEVNTHSRGREVELLGTAYAQADIDKAVALAKEAKGVNSVSWAGELAQPVVEEPAPVVEAPPAPVEPGFANIDIEMTEQTVLIKGIANSAAFNSDIQNELTNLFAPKTVVSELELSDAIEAGASVGDLAQVMAGLPAGTKLSLSEQTLVLSGAVPTLGLKKTAAKTAAAVFDGNIDDQLVVALAEISDADKVSIVECQSMFNELTSASSVSFKSGSDVVLTSSYPLLDAFTTLSRRCPDATFEVGGHTDASGSVEFNNTLSQARAEAVVAHIVNSGVDASRFTAKGYGPSKPIADNGTAEGRAKNRRVEFIVTNN